MPAADLIGDTRGKPERDEHPRDAGERQQQGEVAGARGADRAREHDAERSAGDQRPALHEDRQGGAAAEVATLAPSSRPVQHRAIELVDSRCRGRQVKLGERAHASFVSEPLGKRSIA